MTVLAGSFVELPCRIEGRVGRVQWIQDDLEMGFDPTLPFWPRYSMKVNKKLGIFNLIIRDTNPADSGKYECYVAGNKSVDPIRAVAYVTFSGNFDHLLHSTIYFFLLLVPPKTVSIEGSRRAVVDELVALRCVTSPVFPPQDVRLKWDFGKNQIDYIEHYESSSVATFLAKKEHNDQKIRCKAFHKLLMKPLISIVTIEVECEFSSTLHENFLYLFVLDPPDELTLQITSTSQLQLLCLSSASNPKSDLIWTINNIPINKNVQSNSSSSYSHLNISELTGSSLVRCESYWLGKKAFIRELWLTEFELEILQSENTPPESFTDEFDEEAFLSTIIDPPTIIEPSTEANNILTDLEGMTESSTGTVSPTTSTENASTEASNLTDLPDLTSAVTVSQTSSTLKIILTTDSFYISTEQPMQLQFESKLFFLFIVLNISFILAFLVLCFSKVKNQSPV